jgi:antitoxin component YwqK of YwqJK toxin-antitoxin module|tara:strand:+ start:41 stop:289 length:249 start_codon:yes stop_codon:yes gene_type:complete
MKKIIMMIAFVCVSFAQIMKIQTNYGDSTYVVEYYMNGEIKISGYKVNNFKHGDWLYYRENGKIDKIVRYSNGKKVKTLGGK